MYIHDVYFVKTELLIVLQMGANPAKVRVMFLLLLMVLVSVFPSSITAYQISTGSQNQSPPCKQFNGTMVDCNARNLSMVPHDLTPMATYVDLSMNKIADLTGHDWNNLALLRSLNLSINVIQILRLNPSPKIYEKKEFR